MLKRQIDAATHTAMFADIQSGVVSGDLSVWEAASRLLRAIPMEH